MKANLLRSLQSPLHSSGVIAGLLVFLSVLPAPAVIARGDEAAASPGNGRERIGEISHRGFVFVDGEYLPPPYRVEEASPTGVTINGQFVQLPERMRTSLSSHYRQRASDRGERERGDGERGDGRRGRGRDGYGEGQGLADDMASFVAGQLNTNVVILAREKENAAFIFHHEQVYAFLRHFTESSALEKDFQFASHSPTLQAEESWLTSYSPPPSLVERASELVADFDGVAVAALSTESGLKRLSMFAFPLTIAGMILSFLASGHLVSHPPRPIEAGADDALRLLSQRATVTCLILLIALSALDLVWTLLATQAGQMIEMNPLGSRMVEDPYSLVAFKVTATLTSCGILFALRERQSARLASWWLCLALTLLTFRWLIFNSMQVA